MVHSWPDLQNALHASQTYHVDMLTFVEYHSVF
ncbi:hypothetical protein N476_22885 [Pseudoalteromonas luteoviolacea H33]|uniref:Uncharacterized protein n=1 Tax=Pseudoalteromonas luteoviolacea H33 TaxID=1365251 RepID=A0A167CH79_9GAMM|nr:hypothetical protein N476_22885 [Pseudoalteromonas luteoviolacea H33]KZN75687.1 hypothetical protein N477_17210 [Pseudoalteromonas luteoviolacea H33-S]